MFLTWFRKKVIPKPTIYSLAIADFQAVLESPRKTAYSSDISVISLETLEKNIIDYTTLLETLGSLLENDGQIQTHLVAKLQKRVYLWEFFQTPNGCYLDDEDKALTDFISAAIKFLKVYEEKENFIPQNFLTERNLRVSQHFVTNLINIVKTLKGLNNEPQGSAPRAR